jgi:CRISPR-associated endonuclease/helicase Cas3
MEYYAHSPGVNGEWHLLRDHLEAVAKRAREFAGPFGAGDVAYLAGLLHDVGKFSSEFQRYLRACHEAKLHDLPGPSRGPDHSSAGSVVAQVAWKNEDSELALGSTVAWPIAAHHAGLSDLAALEERLVRMAKEPLVGEAVKTAGDSLSGLQSLLQSRPECADLSGSLAREFFVRMLLSTLVDADRLDTEAWRESGKATKRLKAFPSMSALRQVVGSKQTELVTKADPTEVNRARQEIYGNVLRHITEEQGFFRLSVPTGGGKTRTALSFAVHHAEFHGLRRIVFALPYMTITEQVAAELRDIVGSDTVLEHHSGLEVKEDEDRQGSWTYLAAENWDVPIIVTTTVQLFESLFSNRPGKLRKIHRLAGTVIVLDEAQTLPVPLLDPILDVLSELVQRYNVSVVLSTATQPALDEQLGFPSLANVRELAPEPERYFRRLKRVHYENTTEDVWSWDRVAQEMRRADQVLCVVNTKKHARQLFQALDDETAVHLSTNMCPAHRRERFNEIGRRLKDGISCRVVSTQLIEAGVDLDFPVVMRALGPLDSIVQAAGRCNREGTLPELGRVVIFKPEEHMLPRGVYKVAAQLGENLLQQGVNLDDPSTFGRYFGELYHTLVERDARGIQALRERFNYPEVAEQFRMIADNTVPVVIRTYISERAKRALKRGISRGTMRILQPYLVTIYEREVASHERQGLIAPIEDGLWEWTGTYDPNLGIIEESAVEQYQI